MRIQARKIMAMSILGAFATAGAVAAPVQAPARAKAKMLAQLTIAKRSDLDFGTIVPGRTAGIVKVDRSFGIRDQCAAGLVCSGTRSAALFKVTGTSGNYVNISKPRFVVVRSGGNSMTVTLGGTSFFLLGPRGIPDDVFDVGGDLEVAANQPEGAYESAEFVVSVDYP